jgi:hypothetical protein
MRRLFFPLLGVSLISTVVIIALMFASYPGKSIRVDVASQESGPDFTFLTPWESTSTASGTIAQSELDRIREAAQRPVDWSSVNFEDISPG